MKGTWSGPMGAVLTITDTQWVLNASVLQMTLTYSVVSSQDDVVVVALKTDSGDTMNVTCRIDGNTLRITQPVTGMIALGGTWTRQ